jgi:hypothetical protein
MNQCAIYAIHPAPTYLTPVLMSEIGKVIDSLSSLGVTAIQRQATNQNPFLTQQQPPIQAQRRYENEMGRSSYRGITDDFVEDRMIGGGVIFGGGWVR